MAPHRNQILETDPRKIIRQLALPGLDLAQIESAQRDNVEALVHANQRVAEGLEAVARQQTEILRQTLEEAGRSMRYLMTQSAPEYRMAQRTELANTAFETALANMRELAEMITRSNIEAFDVINRRVADSLEELKNMINHPQGRQPIGPRDLAAFLADLPFDDINISRDDALDRDIDL